MTVLDRMAEHWQYKDINGNWALIPEHMREGLYLYITAGVEPGHFLSAVLCNDLRGACERADDTNRHQLFNYIQFLYCFAPSQCWGSPERFSKWLKQGGLKSLRTGSIL